MTSLISIIKEGPLPDPIKNHLINSSNLKDWQEVWLGYVFIFQPAYPRINQKQFELLNAASYLGARAVYEMDHVYDLQITGKAIRPNLINGQYLFNESQRLLSQLFHFDSPFWKMYYQRLEEHYKELELSGQKYMLNDERYQELLQYKYALMYVPLDALYVLDDQKSSDINTALLSALKFFIKGYNLPNEVEGLADDIEQGINNYAWWRLIEELQQYDIPNPDNAAELQNLLFATRLGETLYDEAIAALEQSLRIIKDFSLFHFENMIKRRIKSTEKRKELVTNHIEQIMATL